MIFKPKTERDYRFLHYYVLSNQTCFRRFYSLLYKHAEDLDNAPQWCIDCIKELLPELL